MDPKHRSREITEGVWRSGHRALLRALGLSESDIERPFIGVANSWNEIVPGHLILDEVGRAVKEGVKDGGAFPFEFETIAICDGIAMGHEGMRASLVSREVIADSVELMAMAHRFDGLVLVSSCDKIEPGMVMAAARLNIPSIFVNGGPMRRGVYKGRKLAYGDVDEAIGAYLSGKMDKEEKNKGLTGIEVQRPPETAIGHDQFQGGGGIKRFRRAVLQGQNNTGQDGNIQADKGLAAPAGIEQDVDNFFSLARHYRVTT